MKKIMLVPLALTLLMSALAVAQYGKQDETKQDATKAVRVTGRISDDGRTFVSDNDGKSWTISNPDALKGAEGQHVVLKANVDADKNEIQVISVKAAKDEKKDTKRDNMTK